MRKKIGVPGSSMGENSFGVQKTYLEMISKFGDPIIIMPNDKLVECDLLILPGGADINTSVYGETPGFYTSNSDVFKQAFYDNKLKLYIESKIPIFAICLGMQQINTFFGGKLVQHSFTHPQSSNRFEKGHEVLACDKEGRVLGGKNNKFQVNSHHHQLVTLNNLSKDLIPLYLAEHEDNGQAVVEALKHKTLPIIGIQWHFEEWFDKFSFSAINHLIELKQEALA